MVSVECIAVDWSGGNEEGQLERIWVAIVQSDSLVRLKNGMTRNEVIAWLENKIRSRGPLVIGFDFAFSFPKWYLTCCNLDSASKLWCLATNKGDKWLNDKPFPFWGGKGHPKPKTLRRNRDLEFRQTDRDHRCSNPKSVFNVHGGGTVGPGTIRGMPALARLQNAGAAIWPFDAPKPDGPNVIEIYPRVFYGTEVTNNKKVSGRDSRKHYLDRHYAGLGRHWRDIMIGSGDAFDAGVSALVMSSHAAELQNLKCATQEPKSVEGEIWSP